MIFSDVARPLLALLAAGSLAGCISSNSGGAGAAAGGGGGGGTPPAKTPNAFETAFDKTSNLGPSTNKLTGKANYKGQVEVLTNANKNNQKEAIFGDLDMEVDFAKTVRPISGTVGNFEGEYDGTPVKITGTLSAANAPNSAPNAISTNTFAVPAPGSGTVTQTGLSATFRGNLDDPNNNLSGEAQMVIQGSVVGSTGQGFIGSNGVTIRPTTGPDVIRGGRVYADRQ